MSLALKYRPQRFADVVGQRAVKVVLDQMVRKQKVPTGLLFAGPRGTGKTSTGRMLAAALNCSGEVAPPCGTCTECRAIADGTSMAVHEIDAASRGSVGDIRQLLDMLQYEVGAAHRVVILDEAHSMSVEAFNALLKTLEEPPPRTVFVLVTTEPNKIIKTVLSRLMTFEFTQIGVDDIVARLQQVCAAEQLSVEPALIDLIAQRANGGMRDAIMTLDQVTRVEVTTVSAFRELMGEEDFAPIALRAMCAGDVAQVFELSDKQLSRVGDTNVVSSALVSCLRDVLVLHAGGQIRHQGISFEVRKSLAAQLTPDVAVAALRVFWTLKTQVRAGDDPRALLELALIMATETMRGNQPRTTAAPAAPAPVQQPLTMSEIQQLVGN